MPTESSRTVTSSSADSEHANRGAGEASRATTRDGAGGGSSLGNRATDPRSGKLTLARTLELTSGLVLLAFVTFMFASYLSVQSIDESFDDVVSVDQPSNEAAAEMTHAADETTIAFLE